MDGRRPLTASTAIIFQQAPAGGGQRKRRGDRCDVHAATATAAAGLPDQRPKTSVIRRPASREERRHQPSGTSGTATDDTAILF